MTGVSPSLPPDTSLPSMGVVQQDDLRCQDRQDAGRRAVLHRAPASSAQRRFEALRAYFLDEMSAAEVADRFGYSTASIHQMASLLRQGRLTLFAGTRPGPKGPRKATGRLRQRVLELRAAGHSVTEIAAACTSEGLPVSAQTCWQILDAEGLPRLPRRDDGRRGPTGPARPGQGRRAARLAGRAGRPAGAITPGCCVPEVQGRPRALARRTGSVVCIFRGASAWPGPGLAGWRRLLRPQEPPSLLT